MNLKEKMGRTFENFWSLNLGHVGIILVFTFGLGLSWQRTSDRIDRTDDKIQVRYESILQSAIADKKEGELKFNSFTERLNRDEDQIRLISDLRLSIATIAGELKSLNIQVSGIRDEIHTQVNKRPE